MSFFRTLTAKPWILSIVCAVLVVLWLASGNVSRELDEIPDPVAAVVSNPGGQGELLAVQVRSQVAEPVTRMLSIYGRTAPARIVELKAETEGRVEFIGLARGEQAAAGTVLVRLDLRDREARLATARADVHQHASAYRGQLTLQNEGYVSITMLAETLARLEAARAELLRAELDLEHRHIRAPFGGVLLERSVEIGDFVRAGDVVATFVDNTSIIVTGSVAEQDAIHLTLGDSATARLVTGQEPRGRIRYIAPVADQATRTFTVELEIPNPDGSLPSGVTAELRIPAGERLAQRISPSLLTLEADGSLGVKVVDEQDQVVFYQVEILRSETNGVWVTGLPASADIIVVGQGYVSTGQRVRPVDADPETALAERRP